jgi:preprotein translocase subunit YajC
MRHNCHNLFDLQKGDEVLTSTGFLATVKEMSALEEGPVHLVRTPGSGVEMGTSSRRAPEKRSRRRPGSSEES